MKNLKFIIAIVALLVFPFLSNAQICCGGIGGAPTRTITIHYVDAGYGPLHCLPSTYQSPASGYQNITGGSSYTWSFQSTSDWMLIDFSAGGWSAVASINGMAIGAVQYYDYVPKSPSGTAPIFSVTKNAAYDYTIQSWAIPQ